MRTHPDVGHPLHPAQDGAPSVGGRQVGAASVGQQVVKEKGVGLPRPSSLLRMGVLGGSVGGCGGYDGRGGGGVIGRCCWVVVLLDGRGDVVGL